MPELRALNTLFLIDFLRILISFLKIFVTIFFFSISGILMNTKKHFKILAGINMFVCNYMF